MFGRGIWRWMRGIGGRRSEGFRGVDVVGWVYLWLDCVSMKILDAMFHGVRKAGTEL